MTTYVEILEAVAESNTVYHSTEWGLEIYHEGIIRPNSSIDPAAHTGRAADLRFDSTDLGHRGVCVTRSFRFAQQFSDTIFGLDVRRLRGQFRMLPRAEVGAYDLADDYGDFRIEAEEFIICPGLDLSRFCTGIWMAEHLAQDRQHGDLARDERFRGYFKPI